MRAKVLLAIAVALLLAACASTGPDLVSSAQVPPKPVVVVEKCLKASEIPPVPPKALKPGTVDQKAAGSGADLLELDAYVRLTQPMLRKCAQE